MVTHSSILVWIEEPVKLQSMGVIESDMTEQLSNTQTIHK